MLTRLKVNGFKNLVDVDVRFGPFTCIAGANGVGKSNLFDAILFLSSLADRSLTEAARGVRDTTQQSTDVESLFLKLPGRHAKRMEFECEMLVAPTAEDELGQIAEASITFLIYRLVLLRRENPDSHQPNRLVVDEESLSYSKVAEARRRLGFDHSPQWRKSVVTGRRVSPFISTVEENGIRTVKLHQEGTSGRPRSLRADTLPRTALSSTNALESPTALIAKREMQSWRLLQLEPTALRRSDTFSAPCHIAADGSHLASTLHHLARGNGHSTPFAESVFARVANRVSQLVEDVSDIDIDVDRQRELLTLFVKDRSGTRHAARALSDGTLRFLALAILELDPQNRGVLCFEEPENGIHPARIETMLELLRDLAVDTDEPVGEDNPLRQVVVNTHSPSVVQLVLDSELLVAHPRDARVDGEKVRGVAFAALNDTWRSRTEPRARPVSRGELAAYLNPIAFARDDEESRRSQSLRRVKDREDLQLLLPYSADHAAEAGA